MILNYIIISLRNFDVRSTIFVLFSYGAVYVCVVCYRHLQIDEPYSATGKKLNLILSITAGRVL